MRQKIYKEKVMKKTLGLTGSILLGSMLCVATMVNADQRTKIAKAESSTVNDILSQAQMNNGSSEKIAKNESGDVSIKEKQVVEINKSLKNVIEENQRLTDKTKELETELRRMQDSSLSSEGKVDILKRERDNLASTVQKIKNENNSYSKEIVKLQENVERLELAKNEFERKTKDLESELSKFNSMPDQSDIMQLASAKGSPTEKEVQDKEDKTLDLLSRIDAFAEEDTRLREDAAKAHYNMGNIYFQRGEYEIAVREYYQAVTLMPDDPDSHYNLAFVSGEYLNDPITALKHYQMYLYLNPRAKDAHLVKEKIVKAKLILKGKVDSPLEKNNW